MEQRNQQRTALFKRLEADDIPGRSGSANPGMDSPG